MNEVELTGHVIVRARELEQALRRAGATSTGLHNAATELEDKLPPECVKKLRFIASVRNRLAHGEELIEPIDIDVFNTACDDVAKALLNKSAAKRRPKDTIPVVPEDDPAAALDVEFQLKVRRSLRLCGTIPLLNSFYFAALVVYALSPAARALFMLTLFAISAPMLIEWARSGDISLLVFGGIFFGAYWILTIIYAVGFNRDLPRVRWYYYSLPLLSVGYLGWCVKLLAARVAFFTGIVPLALNIAAPFFIRSNYKVAAVLTAIAWIVGVVAVIARRKRFF